MVDSSGTAAQTDVESVFTMEEFAEMLVRLVGQISMSRAQLAVLIAAGSALILTLRAIGVFPPSQ